MTCHMTLLIDKNVSTRSIIIYHCMKLTILSLVSTHCGITRAVLDGVVIGGKGVCPVGKSNSTLIVSGSITPDD